jgi:AAA+ superfamily predicted ATPase
VSNEQSDVGPAWFRFGRNVLVRHAQSIVESSASQGEGAPPNDAPATQRDNSDQPETSVAAARDDLLQSLETGGTFAVLVNNAQMSGAEIEVFALLATAESDRYCQQLVAQAQTGTGQTQMTFGLISQLLGDTPGASLALAADAALCRSTFVRVIPDGPWTNTAASLHPSVVWALLGDTSADPKLPADVELFEIDDAEADELTAGDDRRSELLVVNGTDSMRRRQHGAAWSPERQFLCAKAPDNDDAWSALVREATITGRGLIIEVDSSLSELGRKWIERANHLAWVLTTKSGPPVTEMPRRSWMDIVAPATYPTDIEWASMFGPDVAHMHHLTFEQLHRVGSAAKAVDGNIDAAVRRLTSGKLEQFTRRITPTRGWSDIVLSEERFALLRSVTSRYQNSAQVYDKWGFSANPSRGLVALFSGPSGTGKTLASEIIAGELGLDVFKLDLSSVVSKYIGETEKNLEQVFDAASAGNLVLFFDEADSLFGKRSEVKDARDRYANIEVSYLLQRLESYDGLVIMATNFEKNVDEAFLRRIHVRVPFALPGIAERAAIWRHNLPDEAPTDGIDVEWLAKNFELSGGAIRNAAIQAGFVSAAAGTDVSMEAAVLGVARELRKMGRLLKPSDFGEYHDLVSD